MRYRKKPVVIEAYKFTDIDDAEIPNWVRDAFMMGLITATEALPEQCIIKTLEGNMRVDIGDYIIKGIKGELYPCKPDIFAETYEVVQ